MNSPISNLSFNLNNTTNADIQIIIQLLSKVNYDISGCLVNCSNNGKCSLDVNTQMYVCLCSSNFFGTACQIDSIPCSSSKCLNNGTCIHFNTVSNETTYKCECQANFNGDHCENMINSCANRTCSLNGYCFQNETASLCKCFSDFYGDECDLEKSAIKTLKDIQATSLILCLLFVGFTAFTILANDVVNFLMQKSYRSKKSEIKIKRPKIK